MGRLSLDVMKSYLSKSIASFNQNKLNGILSEIDFRRKLGELGLEGRISPGGWIVRNTRDNNFGHYTSVLIPEIIEPNKNYSASPFPDPPRPLHTICSTMHQIGIKSLYCYPFIERDNDPKSVKWFSTQLGIPDETPYSELKENCFEFKRRERAYNFLRWNSEISSIPNDSVAEEFTKENLRVTFSSDFFSETSDIDGIFWGQQYTYPIEIKEKTPAEDTDIGEYFGLDVGPFVKLAFYAAKKGNLHSIFVVREINNIQDRELVQWWYITYDRLAQYASWVQRGGGTSMGGGRSTVVRIPKEEFSPVTLENLSSL